MTGKLLINWLNQRKEVNSHRQLVIVSGAFDWCTKQLKIILDNESSRSLLVGQLPTDKYQLDMNFTNVNYTEKTNSKNNRAFTHTEITQYKQQLGTEFNVLIYNAFDGIKPSALYALEGTIAGGGLLVILCPELNQWPRYEASSSGIAFSSFTKHTTSLFVKRMSNIIAKQTSTAFLSKKKLHFPIDAYQAQEPSELHSASNSTISHTKLSPHTKYGDISMTSLTDEQQQALSKLLNNFTIDNGEKKNIGLIRAKRGRGKSTLIGRLAAELLAANPILPIFITAPHLNNCKRAQTEFKAAIRFINEHVTQSRKKVSPQSILTFIAPDQLLHLDKNAVLIIDEAAAISPRIILNACKHFNQLVMATTVAGYEGSGLGFNLKVLPKLQELETVFTLVELKKAIRWLPDDNLETLFENIFVPPMSSPLETTLEFHANKNGLNELKFSFINKSDLLDDENTLKMVFGLLVQSHYQTTPDDLMRILDAPDHHIAILTTNTALNSTADNNTIVSVAVIVDESLLNADIKEELIEDIICSSRRINGYLVAQNLATTFYDKWFLKSKNWRIVRIAVLPELRQQRIGSLMLSHIQAIATKQHVDYLSTSFGFTSVLFSFWQSQHYKLIKIGARRDTSSGEHSSIWVLPISHRATWKIYSYAKVIINDMDFLINVILKEQSDENWWVNITDLIVDVENELALLGNDAQKTLEATSLSQMTKERLSQEALNTHQSRLTQFIQGRRSYANAAASIFYCFKQHEGNVSLLNEIQQKHHSKAQKLALIDKIKLKVKKNWHINS